MRDLRSISGRVRKRLGSRLVQAMGFMVASSWTEVFSFVFGILPIEDGSFLYKLLFAIIFTIVSALVTEYLLDEGEETEE